MVALEAFSNPNQVLLGCLKEKRKKHGGRCTKICVNCLEWLPGSLKVKTDTSTCHKLSPHMEVQLPQPEWGVIPAFGASRGLHCTEMCPFVFFRSPRSYYKRQDRIFRWGVGNWGNKHPCKVSLGGLKALERQDANCFAHKTCFECFRSPRSYFESQDREFRSGGGCQGSKHPCQMALGCLKVLRIYTANCFTRENVFPPKSTDGGPSSSARTSSFGGEVGMGVDNPIAKLYGAV